MLGVSVAEFDGQEPVEVTEYEYDDQDRVVRSVTRRESPWDEQQQAHMLALVQFRALQCPGCGGHLPDTTAPDAEDRYVTDLPHQCHRCVSLSVASERYADQPHPRSLLFVAKRR